MRIIDEIAAGKGRTLRQIADLLPPNYNGRPVTVSAVLRWVLHGVAVTGGRRVRLEAQRCGQKWLSSLPALRRFLAAQAGTPSDGEERSPAAASRESEDAVEALESAGII